MGAVVRCQLQYLHLTMGNLGSAFTFGSRILLPTSAEPGKQQGLAQAVGSLLLIWEIRIEFLTPCINLTQSWLLWALRGVNQ